jgi:hypothetical protein
MNEKKLENLRRANEESHRIVVDSLREAFYQLLETRNVNDIKVVDLVKTAGVSRGAFYKHFYLVTDVLKDDILTTAEEVRKAMCSDIGLNWEIILETAYCQKKKILLLLKAGMGMEILHQLNHSIDAVDEQYKLRIAAWNGIIFNIILYCADRGFSDSPQALAKQLSGMSAQLLDPELAAALARDYDAGLK